MEEISIIYLLQLAWKRIWALGLSAVFFAVVTFCYCMFFATPAYTATASVLVTNGTILSSAINTDYENFDGESVSGTDISASLNLANTITDILKTPDIYKELAKRFKSEYEYDALMNMATVARRNDNTLFIDVKFRCASEKEAMDFANAFVEISCDYIVEYIPHSNAMVASSAVKASKVFPRTLVSTAVAGIAGAAVAFVIVFIIDASNQTVRGEEEFVANFDVPLIGVVPDFESISTDYYNNYYKRYKNNYYKSGYYKKGGYGSGY